MRRISRGRPTPAAALLLTLLAATYTHGQEPGERLLPEGLGLSNHLEYSYDRDRKLEILENWLNLDYRYNVFTAGLRFEVFQPNDPNPSVSRGKNRYADIAFKYISAYLGDATAGLDITVGNYYALLGHGLILKSYEDRNIRVDNNLLGVMATGHYANIALTALSGRVENFNAQRVDILHAVDIEYKGIRSLPLGATFASNQPDAQGEARTRLASLRIRPSIWNIDLYGEYGVKQNDDTKHRALGGTDAIVGKALYGSAQFFLSSFSVSGEYKLYDNFGFSTSDRTTLYNTPPSVRRDYEYILLNRHPSPLNPDNERGFQVEANYVIPDELTLLVSYGLTKSLGAGSYYQRILGTRNAPQTMLRELFGQVARTWNDDLSTTAACGYTEERITDTRSITPIIEGRYALDAMNSLHLVLEHQHVKDLTTAEQYYSDVVAFEYLRAPGLTLSLVTEMETREPARNQTRRRFWTFGQVGFKVLGHTDASILIGSRQAGNICVGGVCRYEPEFRGVELKLFTRL